MRQTQLSLPLSQNSTEAKTTMTVIVSIVGLLVLSVVLVCERMGSEGSEQGAVEEGNGLLHVVKRAAVKHHTVITGNTSYFCENDQILLLCSASDVVRVLMAVYGRTSRLICNSGSQNFSDHILDSCFLSVLDKVDTQCNGLNKCQFRASSRRFGDPCPGVKKFLIVNFVCSQTEPTIPLHFAYAFEGDVMPLTCPPNKQMAIHNASYGRMSNCNMCAFDINDCKDSCELNVTHLVSSRCSGQMTCWIKVSNDVLTDPCVGIHKYLEVNYHCQ